MEPVFLGYSLGNAGIGSLSNPCRVKKYENHDPAPQGRGWQEQGVGPSRRTGTKDRTLTVKENGRVSHGEAA